MLINNEIVKEFQKLIKAFYLENKRDFPWRYSESPYEILVSEIMLQQTQTYRVEPKYVNFLSHFPTIESLAHASFDEVLRQWKGLGYNRRARALHKCAQIIVSEYSGDVPQTPELLIKLPGIGEYTSRAVITFAFNKPYVFIETNIRSVFIAHFFQEQEQVSDKEIFPLIEKTLDKENPKDWYYALMDYGVSLKKVINPNKKSKHYTVQSKFEGSTRQVRGKILQVLLNDKQIHQKELLKKVGAQEKKFTNALEQLIKDELIVCDNTKTIMLVN